MLNINLFNNNRDDWTVVKKTMKIVQPWGKEKIQTMKAVHQTDNEPGNVDGPWRRWRVNRQMMILHPGRISGEKLDKD